MHAARPAVFQDQHGTHAKAACSVQILGAVFHQHAAPRGYAKARAHHGEHGKGGLGSEGACKAHLLDRHHLSHYPVQPRRPQHRVRIVLRSVGEDHPGSGQATQRRSQRRLRAHMAAKFAHRVGVAQESVRIDAMVGDHAEQGCAVAPPVGNPQRAGLLFVKRKVLRHPLRHGTVDRRHDVGACIVQGVVEIEQPDRTWALGEARERLAPQCERIMVPTP